MNGNTVLAILAMGIAAIVIYGTSGDTTIIDADRAKCTRQDGVVVGKNKCRVYLETNWEWDVKK